ncbi:MULTISPECIES: hypothetical protein [unclassified Pseudoclavibacter]|uniref:hypothetical protein n=1 Tax=unclassified Pseudoclavibacter TaxID=2615177 RepID=UPI00188D26AE|nr:MULTISPECIES: hypothetical protein [unclassified Pseudoclavibacter]MBF4551827.1 hypothetical protein [Pseudoclavibacter sp. VKM Ac-2888]
MIDPILNFIRSLSSGVREFLPLEVAITFGLVLFAVSWVRPRRIVALPDSGFRRTVLLWCGVGGCLLIVAVATLTSALATAGGGSDVSGFDGWWRRPAPLVAAIVVVAVAGLALRSVPLTAPGSRALAPRRRWNAFAPGLWLWVVRFSAVLIAVTALWQILIAVSAPPEGPFFGDVARYTTLPIYSHFNGSFGYLAGAGWPNHLATLATLLAAAGVLVWVLKADANRPEALPAATLKTHRDATARVLTLIVLAGLVTTLGAVWMHVGSTSTMTVGLDERWVSAEVSYPQLYIEGGFSALSYPMNVTGYLLQGVGVALALRLAVDTVRAAAARPAAAAAGASVSAAAR